MRVVVLACVGLVAGCGLDLSQLGDLANKDKGGDDPGGVSQGIGNCDAAANVAQQLASTADPGPPPAMTGGTIVDGTYAQTAHVYYENDANSSNDAETLVFANGTVKQIASDNGGPDQIVGGTVTTSGNALTFTLVCPQALTIDGTYTATDTTFTFIRSDDPDRVVTFTKQ